MINIGKFNNVKDCMPNPCVTVLTWHEEDLAPVCAFLLTTAEEGDIWLKDVEGPEDIVDGREGVYTELYRPPTHWSKYVITEE